ncbi:MAG: acyl-CoA dehydrogenase family protein, partial [Tepidiformaceae bacterium]
FRMEVQAFLSATLTDDFWAYHQERELPGWSPRFSQAAADAGLLGIAWPEAYGGQEKGVIEQTIYMDEMAYAGAPQEHHRRAVQQVGPSILLFGSDEQKERYLGPISRAEISFAMGLSEPNAGSDLANVQCTAIRDGDEYVLNGQKRFTSGAHYSDYLWTVARTDPEAPKHRGISMIAVPLKADGVEVRPLIDMQGRHHFNEVFLTDVRVPVDHRVGEENRGWYVNARTMDLERSGGSHIGSLRRHLDDCLAAARNSPTQPAEARLRLTECATAVEVTRLLAYRVAWLRSKETSPNYEVSIVKNLASETHQRLANLMFGYVGLSGLLQLDPDPESDGWGPEYVNAVSATIGQGSSEIQRNVIATRGLGLPRG